MSCCWLLCCCQRLLSEGRRVVPFSLRPLFAGRRAGESRRPSRMAQFSISLNTINSAQKAAFPLPPSRRRKQTRIDKKQLIARSRRSRFPFRLRVGYFRRCACLGCVGICCAAASRFGAAYICLQLMSFISACSLYISLAAVFLAYISCCRGSRWFRAN